VVNKIAPDFQSRSGAHLVQASQAWPEEAEEERIEPLTAEQAQAWRKTQVQVSLWRVLIWQVLVAMVLAVLAYGVTRSVPVVRSVVYGSMAVILPAVLFAWAMWSRNLRKKSSAGVAGFFLWEFAKVALTVAMLVAAPKWVADLSWPGMLLAFLVTLKVYWVVVLRSSMRKPVKQET